MSRKKKKRLICDVHDEIMDMSEKLQGSLSDKLTKTEMNKLKKIYQLAEEAKIYGQSMEDRLSEYRAGIENIGFTRDK